MPWRVHVGSHQKGWVRYKVQKGWGKEAPRWLPAGGVSATAAESRAQDTAGTGRGDEAREIREHRASIAYSLSS